MTDARYHAPEGLDRALALLDQWRHDALIVAGGTEAVPRTGYGPRHILDISGIAELRQLHAEGPERLRIGALVTCTMLATSELVHKRMPVLAHSALSVGGPQIRNLATIGGNVASRSPRSDLLPALLVLDAVVTLSRHGGSRRLRISEFLAEGSRDNELITLMDCAGGGGAAMQRLSMRRALAPAIASAAVLLHLNATRKGWSQVRIALGGVAPRVMRAHKAEAVLTHVPPFGSEFAQGVRRAGDAAREEANPVSDVWATSWYRRHVIGVLTQRALLQAAKAADAA